MIRIYHDKVQRHVYVRVYFMYKNILTSSRGSKTHDCVVGADFNCLLQAFKENMSDLESGMVTIIQVFHKYSGHKCKLKKAELKALINNEMSHFIMVSSGSESVQIDMFMAALYSIMQHKNNLLTSMCHFHVR